MEEVNILPAAWIKEMLAKGFKSFYQIEKGKRKYFDKNTFFI